MSTSLSPLICAEAEFRIGVLKVLDRLGNAGAAGGHEEDDVFALQPFAIFWPFLAVTPDAEK